MDAKEQYIERLREFKALPDDDPREDELIRQLDHLWYAMNVQERKEVEQANG